MFENGIRISQVLALIRVTHEPRRIRVIGGDLAWQSDRRELIKEVGSHILEIGWDRGIGYGQENPSLLFTLSGFEYSTEWMKKRGIHLWREGWSYKRDGNHHDLDEPAPVLTAYHYHGDNCNERTEWIWQIVALQTKVYDDIGIVGGGWGNYSNGIIAGCKGENFMAREKVEHDKLYEAEWAKIVASGKADQYVHVD